jgi:hypothetical protein
MSGLRAISAAHGCSTYSDAFRPRLLFPRIPSTFARSRPHGHYRHCWPLSPGDAFPSSPPSPRIPRSSRDASESSTGSCDVCLSSDPREAFDGRVRRRPTGLPLHSSSSLARKERSVARLRPRSSLRRSRARLAASELALWRSPASAARTAAGSGGGASAERLLAVHATQRVRVYLMGLAAPFLRYSSGTRLPTY